MRSEAEIPFQGDFEAVKSPVSADRPRRFLHSVTRSWLICCSKYPLIIKMALTSSFLVGVVALLFGFLDLWSSVAFLCFGGLTGMYIAAEDFRLFLGRAECLVQAQKPEATSIERSRAGTGLPDLDNFTRECARRLADLTETAETLEEENSVLIERYEILTENIAASIVIRDNLGQITYCSPYTEVLTGYSVNEMYASEEDFFLGIVHAEDRERYQRALEVPATGEPFQFRFRFVHKTGIEMWAETRTVPILDDEGVLISSLSVTLDVTGTVRYQRQVEEKNRDLQDFTYMVSHDLKSPIFTIQGMLSVIDEDNDGALPAHLAEPLDHIQNAAKRLEALVSSVLEYARVTSTEFSLEAVPLQALIQEVIGDLSAQLNEAQGSIEVPSSLPTVMADRVRLYQVLSNVIGNAIKYRCNERPLQITLRIDEEPKERAIDIAVSDNGLGIPEEKLDLVFRPFKRIHPNHAEGSGIGLACAKRMVEKCGGEIDFESEDGKGSTFVVRLKKA